MKKKKSTFFDKLMVFVAFFAAVFLVCGVLAGKIDPRDNIIFAFFGLAYPFLLLANLIILAYWLFRKRWIFSLLTILIICSGWHTLMATFGVLGNAGKTEKASEDLVRVMTYNVHNFKPYGYELSAMVKDQMLNVIGEQNPDVICFQEFYTKPKGDFNLIDSLKSLLKTKHYYFVPTMQSTSEAIGLAIFSKYPIKEKGNIVFEEGGGNESIFVDVAVKNQLLRIYNVHLQSISFEPEDYKYIDKVKGMDVEKGSSKRIAKMLRNAFKKRSNHVDIMKTHFANCKLPFVVTGDFNDTPASYAVTKMTESLNNAFTEKGQGFGTTYNGKFPNFQIDYIATTKDINVTNYHIIKAKISDHFPVRSDLSLKTVAR